MWRVRLSADTVAGGRGGGDVYKGVDIFLIRTCYVAQFNISM